MARTARVSTGRGNDIVVLNNPSPQRRRSSGGRRRRSRSRRRSSRGATQSTQKRIVAGVGGGFAYGIVEKTLGDKIPTIPLLGKSGTVAAAVYFLKPNNQILKDVGFAAAVIAGYSLGKTGQVSGDDAYVSTEM